VRLDLTLRPYVDFDYPRLLERAPTGSWSGDSASFAVEELPLYPFLGEGEHAALVVERAGMPTRDLALAVAERLGLPAAAVGYAGLKDKAARVVQAFTVTGAETELAKEAFEAAGAAVLTATRHTNKLRLGHLAGNRFEVRIEGGDARAASASLEELARRGAPNWFGPQRFGADGQNAREGFLILSGKKKCGRWRRDLLASALQSFLFNELLARRIEAGLLETALLGDLLQKTDSGGTFRSTEAEVDQERLDRFEVSPTGPLFGKKMIRPEGAAGEAEQAVLAEAGIGEELFRSEPGARRPYRVRPEGVGVREGEEGAIWLDFALPPGAYATSVVREIAASGALRGR